MQMVFCMGFCTALRVITARTRTTPRFSRNVQMRIWSLHHAACYHAGLLLLASARFEQVLFSISVPFSRSFYVYSYCVYPLQHEKACWVLVCKLSQRIFDCANGHAVDDANISRLAANGDFVGHRATPTCLQKCGDSRGSRPRMGRTSDPVPRGLCADSPAAPGAPFLE